MIMKLKNQRPRPKGVVDPVEKIEECENSRTIREIARVSNVSSPPPHDDN
jgi:hypothetical protein